MRFGFIFNEVLNGFRHNITMTIATVLTTSIAIGSFGSGLLVVRLAEQSRNIYLDRIESQVFLKDEISSKDPNCDAKLCKELYLKIHKRADVQSLHFISREQAYTDAVRKFPQYKDVASKDAFPASFMVKLNNPEQHQEFDKSIQGNLGVLNVLNQKVLVDRLFAVFDGLSNIAFTIALIQATGAILLIGNIVQVAAYTRQTEIEIMRLVGATRWYVQLPFLMESIISASIGIVISITGLLLVKKAVLSKITFMFYQSNLIAHIEYSDILYFSAPWMTSLGLVMASATAYLTLRLYIKR